MTITVNTKAYTFDTNVTPDIARHKGPAHTFETKDYLDLKRTAPKPSADFAGVARAGVKFVRTVTLSSSEKADAIIEVNVSLPVGMAEADIDSLRDDTGDLLLLTAADDLFVKHKIIG